MLVHRQCHFGKVKSSSCSSIDTGACGYVTSNMHQYMTLICTGQKVAAVHQQSEFTPSIDMLKQSSQHYCYAVCRYRDQNTVETAIK